MSEWESKASTVEKGRTGENRACSYLFEHGYKIITRNYRELSGEIDIIAYKDETLVFCEVKRLPAGNLETLAHELNLRKQQKIIKTAKLFVQKYRQYSKDYIRFDVLAVDVPGLEPVYHIVNAFSES